MVTLISVHNKSGCVGRCDAKCYNAQSIECDCICGGANHGAGLEKACENTREMVDLWVEDYAREKGLTDYRTKIKRSLIDQMSIFEIPNFSKQVN